VDCPTWDGVLLAGAAVLAAGIAAATAIWRQRKQLDAEARRLREQLAHDRSMRELEETRTVLDDAMQAVSAAIEWTASRKGNMSLAQQIREEAPGVDQAGITFREAKQVVAESTALLTGLTSEGQRLRIRFGDAHELFKAYEKLVHKVNKTITLAGESVLTGEADEEVLREAGKKAGAEIKVFVGICLKYTALELKPSP
jgi:hypothetical protein